MSVLVPHVLVLIVCKTVIAGPPDQNSAFTGWENRDWAIENSMMQCRRHEVELYDPVDGQKIGAGDPAQPLNPNFSNLGTCARAGIRLSKDWDDAHRSGPWRVWRVGCPRPIVDLRTGHVVGYKLPDCGHRDTVVCETDSEI